MLIISEQFCVKQFKWKKTIFFIIFFFYLLLSILTKKKIIGDTLLQSIFKLIYYVDLSRFELMVHLIWHQYGIIKLGKLKYDFMSPTNKIWIIVSKTRKTLILYLNDTEWGFDVMHSSKQWFIQAWHPQTWLCHRLTKTLVMCDLQKMLNIHFFIIKYFVRWLRLILYY